MNKKLIFELKKIKKNRWLIFAIAFFTEVSALYFFTVVGRFNPEEGENILNTYSGIGALSNTVVMCVMIIYGTVLVNKAITNHYITNSRSRLYLYPNGRSALYFLKNNAFIITFGVLQLLGSLSGSFIYILSESFFPIVATQSSILNDLDLYCLISFSATFLTLTVVILSSIIGIAFKSSNSTIVSGIIGVAFVGNLLAMLFMQYPYIIFSGTIILFLLSFLVIKINGNNIQKDEIIYSKKK